MLAIDGGRHQVFVDGKQIHVPIREWKLMQYLIARPGQVLKGEQIYEAVWGMPAIAYANTLRTNLSRLRKKTGMRITPLHHAGYRYDMDDCASCPNCGRAMIEAE